MIAIDREETTPNIVIASAVPNEVLVLLLSETIY